MRARKEMAEAIAALSLEVRALAEAQKRTDARLEELPKSVAEIAELVKIHSKDNAMLKGFTLEQRFRLNPNAFFWREYRKLRALQRADLARVEDAYARDEFSPEEWEAPNKLDLPLLGVIGKGGSKREAYLAMEVSWVIEPPTWNAPTSAPSYCASLAALRALPSAGPTSQMTPSCTPARLASSSRSTMTKAKSDSR